MHEANQRALIIGGGIGGLTTALALRRAGIDAVVFERMPEPMEVGAGISLWINGTRALQRLELGAPLRAIGAVVESSQFRTWRGQPLLGAPVGELARRADTAVVQVRRPDLLSMLARSLDDGVVRTGAECIGFRQDATGVTARFADGREERGTLMIGADGLGSSVRAQLFGAVKPRYAGYQYLRALCTFEHRAFPAGTLWLLWGRGTRFGMAHVAPGQVYWFAVVNASEGAGDAPIGRKRELLERFLGWAAPVEALIEATPEAAIGRKDIYDLDPMACWGKGRVTLLGDAAHATTPNLGRGASEALEDAVVLAECLQANGDVVAALRAYEARRIGPTARVMTQSRRIGQMAQWRNPVLCALRETLMRQVMGRVMLRGLQADLAGSA